MVTDLYSSGVRSETRHTQRDTYYSILWLTHGIQLFTHRGKLHAQLRCDAGLALPPLQRCNAMPRCAPYKTDVDAQTAMPATTLKAHKTAV